MQSIKGRSLTLAERNELRAELLRVKGQDWTIQEKTADAIRQIVDSCWIIQSEQFNGNTLRFQIAQRSNCGNAKRRECEMALYKFGNPPFSHWVDIGTYEIRIGCN